MWYLVFPFLVYTQVAGTLPCFDPVGVPKLYSWRKLAALVVLLLASSVASEAKFVLFMSFYNLDAFQMSLNAWHRQWTVTLWQVNQIVLRRPFEQQRHSEIWKYGKGEIWFAKLRPGPHRLRRCSSMLLCLELVVNIAFTKESVLGTWQKTRPWASNRSFGRV